MRIERILLEHERHIAHSRRFRADVVTSDLDATRDDDQPEQEKDSRGQDRQLQRDRPRVPTAR